MSAPMLTQLLECAVAAARAAGDHAVRHAHRRMEVTRHFAHDVKLVLDEECQQKAESVIRSAFPGHAILGEEGGSAGDGSQPLWIVDPIDGTVNFSHGLPLWCASVAVRVGGRVVAGAVFAPELNDLYTATVESPALCNGRPIHVSATADATRALVLTGLEKALDAHLRSIDVVREVSQRVQKIRLMGAAALDICHVACGKADAFFERGIHLWDIAAGSLMVQQAGGRVEVLRELDQHRVRYLCSNGLIHDTIREVLDRDG